MKKTAILAITIIMLIAVNNVTAQTKIGYLRIDDIVGLMPELQKISMDTVGQKFIQDSVLPRYQYLQSEYNRNATNLADTTKPASVRSEILKTLQAQKLELDGFDQVVAQVQQHKQQELLRPYYVKAKKALNDVAKEKGYTYVLATDAVLVAPDGDDLSLAVLAKLGIKAPGVK